MKKLLSFFLAFAVSAPLLAQKEKFNPSTGALLDGKTIIKANVTSPLLNSYKFLSRTHPNERLELAGRYC